MIHLVLILGTAVTVLASRLCPPLPIPRNSFTTSVGSHYPGKIVQFRCAKGYLFPDKESARYSKCVYIKEENRSQWTATKFLEQCYEYCNGCGDWGRCVFDSGVKRFRCQCPLHFDGEKCERVVCVRPGSISNGYVYNSIGKGKVPMNTFIEYACHPGYKLVGYPKIKCMYDGVYYPNPPRCIADNSTNVQCVNELARDWIIQESAGVLFKVPQPNVKRAVYSPREQITLQCPEPTKMPEIWLNTKQLRLTCMVDGTWSDPWPLCKVPVCKWPVFPRGTTEMFSPFSSMFVHGSHIVFQCETPYHLYGNKYATCLKTGEWDLIPDCVTLQVFKNRCILDGFTVEFQGYNKSEPVCVVSNSPDEEAAKKQLKTITVVTSTAAVIFGILLIIVAGVAFQRRRLLSQIRRLQQSESEERDRSNLDNDVYAQFILPSYDQSQKDKPNTLPPSFDEALREGEECGELQELGAVSSVSPPPPTDHPMSSPPPPFVLDKRPSTSCSSLSSSCSNTSDDSGNGVYLDDVMLL